METLQELVKRVLGKETDFEELENSDKHIVLWTWLSENWKREKFMFFEEFEIANKPISECYACEQAACDGVESDCCYCPINWNSESRTCIGGEYTDWNYADKKEERSKPALTIAHLPWENKQ
jgi:hypothetical protein